MKPQSMTAADGYTWFSSRGLKEEQRLGTTRRDGATPQLCRRIFEEFS